jgi:uncharacterized protein (TIGR03435 family)
MKVLGLVLAIGVPVAGFGQAAVPAKKALEFDVVSVKDNDGKAFYSDWRKTPSGLHIEKMKFRQLLGGAMPTGVESGPETTVLPKWADSKLFDVDAKVALEDAEAFKHFERYGNEVRAMLLRVLEDRFQLKVHYETRQLTVYSLVVAKGGVKMQPAVGGEAEKKWLRSGYMPGYPRMVFDGKAMVGDFRSSSMAILAKVLSAEVPRVSDATGLPGLYDFKLTYWPGIAANLGAKRDDNSDVQDIFVAVQQQLGLKLVPGKGSVQVAVVDHVEQPSAN